MSSPAEVLIPHWNLAAKLRATLAALAEQTRPVPVRVIDNGSTDGTPLMMAREFPGVECLRLPSNFGFGAAVNRGAEVASATTLILLNNDARPDSRFVEKLLAAREAGRAEMVAGCLRRPDGRIESLGVGVDRSLVAFDVGYGLPYEARAWEGARPLAPSGGAAAFDREAFLAAGGFDEGFFAYLEDVDLGIRMRGAGMRCESAPEAFAWHQHASTLGSGGADKNRLMGRSRGYLLWKYRSVLPFTARARGALIDGIVYAGQLAVDRNAGSLRGRLEIAGELRSRPAPPAPPGARALPVDPRSALTTLRARLARR